MKKLIEHLDKNFDRKSESKEKDLKSSKQLAKMFVSIIKSIRDLYPEMTKPMMYGHPSGEQGIASLSNLPADSDNACSERSGMIDPTETVGQTIGKPIGAGKSHKKGNGDSKARITDGNEKLLAPSSIVFSGNDMIPEPKVAVTDAPGRPVVFFSAQGNRLVINTIRPCSHIILDAKPKDPAMKSRILPLFVRAGIDAFPGSSELSKEEWFTKYDAVLDSVWANE
jgi:hypothetical protein